MSLRRSTRWYSATPLVAIMPASPGSETAAVIFDLDGVLLDSEPVWEEERRRFVDEHHGHWRDDSQQRLMGMSTGEWARYLSADLGVDMPPDAVAAEVIERMKRHYEREMPLFAGASDAVRRLARQWPLGVASSSPRTLLDFVLDRSGSAALFSATVSSDEVGHGKPAPDVYEEAARRLGTQPENAWPSRIPVTDYARRRQRKCESSQSRTAAIRRSQAFFRPRTPCSQVSMN